MTNLALIENDTLSVTDIGGELVVDSRLIATRLGIQHESFLKTIKKYESKIEQRFGCIRFEIGVPDSPTGNPPKYALLNEPQINALMSFSKNTDEVVECKLDLVAAFDQAKQIIKAVIPAQNDRIRELELELKLLDRRETIYRLQPKAIADRISGVTEIQGEIKTRTVVVDQMGNVVNAGDTLTKTQIAHELGFINGKGKAETKQVANLVNEAIRDGAIPMPWRDERTVIATGFDAELLPKLKAYYQTSPAQRQRWMGETNV
jgi:anti-repressor protein